MGKQQKHSLLAVDDHPVFVDGLASILSKMKNVGIIFKAYSGQQAIELYIKHQPDIVLMDLRMKEMDGFECMEKIREQHADAKFIVVSMHDDEANISRALSSGIAGYLIKNADKDEVEHCLNEVMKGKPYFSADIARILNSAIHEGVISAPYGKNPKKLSDRETEVLQCIISGYIHKEIADRLSIEPSTVATHAKHIHEKLKTYAPYWLTMYALENNILPIEEPEHPED
jgi:DNA-binding NarL/FixJ family response regulator